MASIAAATAPASLGASELLGTRLTTAAITRSAPPPSAGSSKIVALFSKKAAPPPPKSKPAAVSPADEELAKWYGELIYSLFQIMSSLSFTSLSPTTAQCCDGSQVPTDESSSRKVSWIARRFQGISPEKCRESNYGYDPFGLSKKPEDFAKDYQILCRYQAYELIHARWAMLGAAGFIIPEAFNKFGANFGPEAVWFKTGALLLDGSTLNYFGKNIPINLVVAVIAEIVLVGGAEYFRIINGLDLEDKLHPGWPFDPLGLANDPHQAALLKVKEIKNGRLAMFAMLGFFLQAYVTGEGPVENLTRHLSDPFGNNLLTVISGAAERAPTL
ncbi:unnamed protein product [Musa hybrid cultivar]